MFIRSVFDTADTAGSVPVSNTIAVGSGNGSNLNPKAAFYEITGTTTLNGGVAHRRYGIGITDGTTQRCLGVMSENGQPAVGTDAGTRADNASVINFPLTTSEAIDGEASWDSWVNGGSKILVNNLFSVAAQIRATYFFGDDVQCAVAELTVSQGSTGSVTGLSFAPNFAMAIAYSKVGAAFSNDIANADMVYSHGYAVKTPSGSIQQVCFADYFHDRSATTAGGTIIRDDSIVQHLSDIGGTPILNSRLRVTSWNADGVTLEEVTSVAPGNAALLLIGFTNKRKLWAGVKDVGTPGSGDQAITDPGFTPEAYLALASTCSTVNSLKTTAGTGAGKASSGSYTGAESGYNSGVCDDGVSTGASRSASGDNAVFRVVNSAGTDVLVGTHVSLDENGFTINVATGGEANLVAFVAIGPPQIIETETENITDQHAIDVGLAVSDSETIVDQHAIDVGMATSDTETISDETAIAVDMATSDTEDIDELIVMNLVSGDDLLLVLMESETIEDNVVFSGTGNLVLSETVEIADMVYMAGDALMVLSDSETLTEDEQEYLGNLIVISDTETITDELSTPLTTTQAKGTNRGTTLQGGAEEGEALQGGAERGTVL